MICRSKKVCWLYSTITLTLVNRGNHRLEQFEWHTLSNMEPTSTKSADVKLDAYRTKWMVKFDNLEQLFLISLARHRFPEVFSGQLISYGFSNSMTCLNPDWDGMGWIRCERWIFWVRYWDIPYRMKISCYLPKGCTLTLSDVVHPLFMFET